MAKAKKNPTSASPALIKKLATWHALKAQAAELALQEVELRKEIFGDAFPAPEEGSKYNKLDLPDGYMLQGDYKINRKIDEAALGEVQKQMDAVMFNRAIRFKPELNKSGFKDIPEDQRKLLNAAIIATPGTPSLDIVQKKK